MPRPAALAALTAAVALLPAAAAAAPPLAGALGEYLPDAVDVPAFEAAGEGALRRYEGAAEAVVDLYDPAATAEEQRRAVATVRAAADRLAADPAPAAADLRGALARRADLAGAGLDALAAAESVSLAAARNGANARLAAALDGLRAYLGTVPNGSAWLPFARAGKLDAVVAGTSDGAAEALDEIMADLEDPGSFDEAQAAFLSAPAWRELLAAARLRRAVASDPDGTVGERPAAVDAARTAVARFARGFEARETAGLAAAGRDLRGAAEDLAAVAPPAAGVLSGLLEALYDGDNYRAGLGEGLLRRFVAQSRTERGRVKDVFEGTRVTGTQTTDVRVDVDVVPDSAAARIDFTLAGVARTETVGLNRRATVNTSGRHRFVAAKTVHYDGTRFRPGRTVVDVDPTLVNTRIRTRYDGLAGGLLDDLIQERAFAEAARRSPAARVRAARSIERTLRPRLDRQIGEQFDRANLLAGGPLRKRLGKLGLAPSRERVRSTDDLVLVAGRLSDPDARAELAGTPAPPLPVVYDGAAVQLHAVRRQQRRGPAELRRPDPHARRTRRRTPHVRRQAAGPPAAARRPAGRRRRGATAHAGVRRRRPAAGGVPGRASRADAATRPHPPAGRPGRGPQPGPPAAGHRPVRRHPRPRRHAASDPRRGAGPGVERVGRVPRRGRRPGAENPPGGRAAGLRHRPHRPHDRRRFANPREAPPDGPHPRRRLGHRRAAVAGLLSIRGPQTVQKRVLHRRVVGPGEVPHDVGGHGERESRQFAALLTLLVFAVRPEPVAGEGVIGPNPYLRHAEPRVERQLQRPGRVDVDFEDQARRLLPRQAQDLRGEGRGAVDIGDVEGPVRLGAAPPPAAEGLGPRRPEPDAPFPSVRPDQQVPHGAEVFVQRPQRHLDLQQPRRLVIGESQVPILLVFRHAEITVPVHPAHRQPAAVQAEIARTDRGVEGRRGECGGHGGRLGAGNGHQILAVTPPAGRTKSSPRGGP